MESVTTVSMHSPDVDLPSVKASLPKPSANAAKFRYDPLADCIPVYAQGEKYF